MGDEEASGLEASNLEAAYVRVRSAILAGELLPGSDVSQVRLSRQLGISRTPLREALRLLQREGLVVAQHNRRVRIAAMSSADLEQLYALRITVEALAVRLTAACPSAADISHLEALLEAMRLAGASGDEAEWEHGHRDFHRMLVSGAGMRVVALAADLWDQAERYRRAYLARTGAARRASGDAEHQAILAACAAQDPDLAATLLARHLARTALTLLLDESPHHNPVAIRTALRSATGDG